MIKKFLKPSNKIALILLFASICVTSKAQTYQFIGNGNWTVNTNWLNGSKPPVVLPAGDTIIISPVAGDSCVLNVTQTISPGAKMIIASGANFIILDGFFLNTNPPAVTTIQVNEIRSCRALFQASVTSNGGSPVTARGFVWGTSPHPTIANDKTIDQLEGFTWESRVYGLTASTQYYVRAYATNSDGTSYGVELTFTTSPVSIFVTTNQNVVNITDTTADAAGSIPYDSCTAGLINKKGIVFDTLSNITFDDAHTTNEGPRPGLFTSHLTNLLPGKTYFFKAYCTTFSGDTFLGSIASFTTASPVPDSLLIEICNKKWMKRNLGVVTYRNGDTIPQVTDATQWRLTAAGAWCYYNNDPSTEAVYGKLYNWNAVNDPRGLAPTGWHIPTNSEWFSMVACIDPSADTTCEACIHYSTAGPALKDTGTVHWQTSTGTNSSGFTALGAGGRNSTGAFSGLKQFGEWWTSTTLSGFAKTHGVSTFSNSVIGAVQPKNTGCSVRCVKD
ncbi:MAG: fibrobacter succinogenes major paralogous domain-containing protein [Bacteroidota bacterium]